MYFLLFVDKNIPVRYISSPVLSTCNSQVLSILLTLKLCITHYLHGNALVVATITICFNCLLSFLITPQVISYTIDPHSHHQYFLVIFRKKSKTLMMMTHIWLPADQKSCLQLHTHQNATPQYTLVFYHASHAFMLLYMLLAQHGMTCLSLPLFLFYCLD